MASLFFSIFDEIKGWQTVELRMAGVGFWRKKRQMRACF
jgi:hypothetical protein